MLIYENVIKDQQKAFYSDVNTRQILTITQGSTLAFVSTCLLTKMYLFRWNRYMSGLFSRIWHSLYVYHKTLELDEIKAQHGGIQIWILFIMNHIAIDHYSTVCISILALGSILNAAPAVQFHHTRMYGFKS